MMIAAPAHNFSCPRRKLSSILWVRCSLALSACVWIGIAFSAVGLAQAEPSDSRPAIIHPWTPAEPEGLFDLSQETKSAPSAFLREIRVGDDAEKSGDYATAIDQYTKAVGLAGANDLSKAIALTRRGTALARTGKAREALQDHARALALSKQHPNAYYGRALTFLELKRYEDALKDYDTLLGMAPNNANGHFGRGNALKNLGRLGEARTAYDKAIEIDPDNTTVLGIRAGLLCQIGEHGPAISDYTRLLEAAPRADTFYDRGYCFGKQGKHLSAVADYTRAIQHLNAPNVQHNYRPAAYRRDMLVRAYVNRGNTYRDLGKFDEALADYARSQQLNRNYVSIYRGRGWLYQQQDQFELARGEYLSGLKLAPDDEWLNKALKHLDAKGR